MQRLWGQSHLFIYSVAVSLTGQWIMAAYNTAYNIKFIVM